MTGAQLAGEIPYTVRRSGRARRVRVNVNAHTGVEVVLPARAPDRAAAAAVRELRPWIERRLDEEIARRHAAEVSFAEGPGGRGATFRINLPALSTVDATDW